jgi:hypothetical protein
MKVTVINRHTAPLHLPPIAGMRRSYSGQTLAPGVNEVDADYLDALEDHLTVQEWIRLKMIGGKVIDAEHASAPAKTETASPPSPPAPAKPAESAAPPVIIPPPPSGGQT